MLRQLNYYLQVFWILAIVMLVGIQLVYFQNSFDEIIIFYLLLAFFMGLNHIIASIIHVFRYQSDSVLKYHLVATISLFLLWTTIGLSGLNAYFDNLRGFQVMLLVWIPPGVLTIYFWYITYTEFSIRKSTTHSYLDL